jgi:hypothetical protein
MAPNPNRITQPFSKIGVDSEPDLVVVAKERYYWSKVRQSIKAGMLVQAAGFITESDRTPPRIGILLTKRAADTFTAGCVALRDPAPLDKETGNG